MHEAQTIARRPGRWKAILAMCRINVETWRTSAKTLVALFFTVAICYTEVLLAARNSANSGWAMYFGETMFLSFNAGFNSMMTSMLLLVTVTELPRRIPFQSYALVRGRRYEWLAGQLLYCAGLAAFMLLLVTACTALFSIGQAEPGSGWSDTARIAAGEIEEWDGIVSPFVRAHFTPLTGCLYAAAPLLLFWFTMLCVLLLCSVWGAPLVGVAAYAFLLWAGLIVDFSGLVVRGLMLPKDFATLRYLGLELRGTGFYWRVIAGYFILDAALIATMFLRVKYTDMVFDSENRF